MAADNMSQPNLQSQMSAFTEQPSMRGTSICVENQPRWSFADGSGGVDFRTEFYARDGVVPTKAKQDEIALEVERNPFYGEIPSGFAGLGNRAGEILVYDNNGLRICNKSDVPGLSSYKKLPVGWETTIEYVPY